MDKAMATTEPLHRTPKSFEDDPSNDTQSIGLNNTLLLVALFSAFTLLPVCYLCVRRRYLVSDNPATTTTTTTEEQPARRGLDNDAIESLPTMLYSDVKQFNLRRGSLECAICLSEFEDGDTLRHLPHCSHAFHQSCIDTWLESHDTCPVCRADLRASYVSPVAAPVTPPEEAVMPAVEVAVSEMEEEVRVWTPEEKERFTLRLPDNLRVELSSMRLSRSARLDSRRVVGKGKRDGWTSLDSDKLSLLSRTFSLRSPRGGGGRRLGVLSRDEAESSSGANGHYRQL